MSWSPEVLGHGPFHEDIADYLSYPRKEYEGVVEGTPLCGSIGGWATKTQAVEFLQDVLHMSWRMMNVTMDWRLVPVTDRIIADAMWGTLESLDPDETVQLLRRMKRLQQHGWTLYFEPNS